MARRALILGNTGTGKSTSTESLDPRETIMIKCFNKELPYRHDRLYSDSKDGEMGKNLVKVTTNDQLLNALKGINSSKRSNITIIVDDHNYLMTREDKNKKDENGFGKFTDMAYSMMDIFDYVETMREDIFVVFMAHVETNEFGDKTYKTIGKMVSQRYVVEGTFTIVFESTKKWKFKTQGSPAKTPKGMFDLLEIDNDLYEVKKAIYDYYELEFNDKKFDYNEYKKQKKGGELSN